MTFFDFLPLISHFWRIFSTTTRYSIDVCHHNNPFSEKNDTDLMFFANLMILIAISAYFRKFSHISPFLDKYSSKKAGKKAKN